MISPPDQLACPNCSGNLGVDDEAIDCPRCGPVGKFSGGVWDFAFGPGYSETFGVQWKRFNGTQLDSVNGTRISHDRFFQVTEWDGRELEGERVLDGGCGAGRFAEVAAGTGADVTALDLSEAAYTTRKSVPHENVTVVRGDLLAPPLRRNWFDRVFSIGVLQHTPDPVEACRQLVRVVRPGGRIAIWMYERRWFDPVMPKGLLRPLARQMSPDSISRLTTGLVAAFTPVARGISRLPRGAQKLRAALPIASYWGTLPLEDEQQREWSLLDTYDWLSPVHDHPQSFETIAAAMRGEGAVDVRRSGVPGLGVVATKEG